MRQLMLTFSMLMFATGCDVHLHPYKDYLNQSVGRVDHDAVAEKMGAPNREVALDKGGDVWTYAFCPAGAISTPNAPSSPDCENLNLVFDKSGILVRWHDQHIDATYY